MTEWLLDANPGIEVCRGLAQPARADAAARLDRRLAACDLARICRVRRRTLGGAR